MTVTEPSPQPTSNPAPATGRVQLALNVSDLDQAVGFYQRLFGVEPAKRKPGYANFAIAEPPLKLVLIESPGAEGRLNHLGVEVPSTDQVTAARHRLGDEGLETTDEDQVTCCFAVQDKAWVEDPDGAPWEIYTVLADSDARDDSDAARLGSGSCGPVSDGPCCT